MIPTIERISEELKEEATRRGVPVEDFAQEAFFEVSAAKRDAENSTNDHERDLRLRSTLDTFIPGNLKALSAEPDMPQLDAFGLLLLLLAIAYMMSSKADRPADMLSTASRRRSVLEFAGVGKGRPSAIGGDIQGYVRTMRNEWDDRERDLDSYRGAASPS